jgi:hypothetical protein
MKEGVPTKSHSGELDRLLKVAKAQRGVNICILLSILCYAVLFIGAGTAPEAGAGPPAASTAVLAVAGLAGVLVVAVLQIIYVYRLAASLGSGVPIVWVLGIVFLSCIGLILLLVLSSKATKQLREAGFQVGLLGGNPKDVEARMGRA